MEYKIRLVASIDCIRFLLRQGLAFRGNDKRETSNNRGNFLELLQFLGDHNENIKAVILTNAPENLKLTSSDIQKYIVNVAAIETLKIIVNYFCDDFFSVLIDESHDVSTKEQMSIIVRYVDKRRDVIECFLGIEHVSKTTSISLKATLDDLFLRHGLSISKLRGQGYDGASNMQGSCKRRDLLREKHVAKVVEALNLGEIPSGRGLNQETSLVKAGDTRWGSHYGTLVNMIRMFSSVIDVHEIIVEDVLTQEQKYEANELSNSLQAFDFVFSLHLMRVILGVSNELSQALQRKEQDIVNVMNLVRVCKHQLQEMRNNVWDSLLNHVTLFCQKHEIEVCNMDAMFLLTGRSRRKAPQMTNLHYYPVELFYAVIDLQLMELENRFSETSTDLLLSMSCLNPKDSFSAFDKNKLIQLARFYPSDFSEMDLMILDDQLETYIVDMRTTTEVSCLRGISDLAKKMVERGRDKLFPLVYLLIKLGLTLPVATATVERTFSAMNIVKNRLCNKMGDQWMNDSLIAYIGKDFLPRLRTKTS